MDIFGIGPLEVAFILILVIIIFGPKDLVKTGKSIGKSLNKFVRSDTWKTINQTTQELKNLPNRLMREAGLDELEQTARESLARIENNTIRPPIGIPPAVDTSSIVIGTPENPPRPNPPTSQQPGSSQPLPPDPVKPPERDNPE
jgi:Sec-independent protein translocase protein TatA